MNLYLTILILILLFSGLGFSASILVGNVKELSKKMGLPIFIIGIILGIFTSLPELIIGINAVYDNVPDISVGNIFGGIIVMIGLILGIGAISQKSIKTDGNFLSMAPYILIIALAIILGLDGMFDFYDGLILCIAYLFILMYFYRKRKILFVKENLNFKKEKITKELLLILICGILIIIISDFIITTSEHLLLLAKLEAITLGVLFFSIGTNLPELSIALSSVRKKTGELTLSHMLSSSATNILALGIIVLLRPMPFVINPQTTVLIGTIIVGLLLLSIFYITDKKLDRKEGFVLLFLYIIFVLSQVVF